jgi:hypothetical protein
MYRFRQGSNFSTPENNNRVVFFTNLDRGPIPGSRSLCRFVVCRHYDFLRKNTNTTWNLKMTVFWALAMTHHHQDIGSRYLWNVRQFLRDYTLKIPEESHLHSCRENLKSHHNALNAFKRPNNQTASRRPWNSKTWNSYTESKEVRTVYISTTTFISGQKSLFRKCCVGRHIIMKQTQVSGQRFSLFRRMRRHKNLKTNSRLL